MLSEEEISERNGYLIALVNELNLGFHVVQLPHKPRLLSADYKLALNMYVKNFTVYLKPTYETEEVYYSFKLKPLKNLDLEEIKEKIIHWLNMFEHKQVYAIKQKDSGLFLVGFNHHNKILKTNPYPVFANYDPITYFELERAEDILDRFKKYNLTL